MKKQEKIDILQRGIDEKQMCRCYFSYDDNYCYYYPNQGKRSDSSLDQKRMISFLMGIASANSLN